MKAKTQVSKVPLDWAKLLGFDQVDGRGQAAPLAAKVGEKPVPAADVADPRMSKLGSKVGAKDGIKSGMADPRMARLGAKVGSKPGIKARPA